MVAPISTRTQYNKGEWRLLRVFRFDCCLWLAGWWAKSVEEDLRTAIVADGRCFAAAAALRCCGQEIQILYNCHETGWFVGWFGFSAGDDDKTLFRYLLSHCAICLIFNDILITFFGLGVCLHHKLIDKLHWLTIYKSTQDDKMIGGGSRIYVERHSKVEPNDTKADSGMEWRSRRDG